MAKRMIEKRRRGFFGYAFLGLFWAFNAFMVFALFVGLAEVGSKREALRTVAEQQGHDIGTVIGVTMILGIWALGAVILGLCCILTRGKREWIEVEG